MNVHTLMINVPVLSQQGYKSIPVIFNPSIVWDESSIWFFWAVVKPLLCFTLSSQSCKYFKNPSFNHYRIRDTTLIQCMLKSIALTVHTKIRNTHTYSQSGITGISVGAEIWLSFVHCFFNTSYIQAVKKPIEVSNEHSGFCSLILIIVVQCMCSCTTEYLDSIYSVKPRISANIC